jgi:hypothetical protein
MSSAVILRLFTLAHYVSPMITPSSRDLLTSPTAKNLPFGLMATLVPPYSPDLNPIENLWAIMKAKIYELYPHLEYAPDSEATLNELIKAAKEAWQVIDERVLQHLSNTTPHRVQAIITADRWYTKY